MDIPKTNYEPLSPLMFLERAKDIYPQKTAIEDTSIKKSYLDFYLDCQRIAQALSLFGIKKDDRIAYLCRNNHYLLEAYYAVPMSGAILVPINVRLSMSDVSFILKQTKAKILFVEEHLFNPEYTKLVKNIVILSSKNSLINSTILYEDFTKMSEKRKALVNRKLNEQDIITINYTSGTSGLLKGVMNSHRSVYLNALGECIETELTFSSKFLWILPMFHCNGWCFTWAVTAVGATHYCLDHFVPELVINLILEKGITHFCAAPSVLIKLQESKNFFMLKDLPIPLKILTAGSSPSPTLIRQYEEHNICIIHVYGLTETHGPHLICKYQSHWDHLSIEKLSQLKACQGIPSIHGSFMRVVDSSLKDVPHDGKTLGEIILRGNNVMKGYYMDPKYTRKVFRKGWFHTGDVAVMNSDGYVEIKDRLKDIIISGGENISSVEIENVLYQHFAVSVVAVIPMQDEMWGEVPHAIIELKDKAKVTEKDLIDFCRKRLAHFKCPKTITFQDIPRTSTGKIQKHILKNKFYQNRINSLPLEAKK